MFTYILWGIIILAIVLSIRRIAGGVVVTLVLIGAIFLSVFLLDSGSGFPLRDIIPLNWYDETLEDPQGKVEEIGKGFEQAGKEVADKVNEKGKELDIKYGTEENKEWVKEEKEPKEEVEEEEIETSKPEKKEKGKEEFIKYKDLRKAVDSMEISESDKDLILSMSSIYKTKIEGKDIVVWNNTDKGNEGVYIKY